MGRDALRADFTEQLRDLGVTILHVANHVIDVVDERLTLHGLRLIHDQNR